MKGIWQRISAEPAVVTGAVMASINVIAAFRLWVPLPAQLAAINSALAAVFAVVVRATVEPRHGKPVRVHRAGPRKPQKHVAKPGAPINEPTVTKTHSHGGRVPAGPGLRLRRLWHLASDGTAAKSLRITYLPFQHRPRTAPPISSYAPSFQHQPGGAPNAGGRPPRR